jgi:hypothetical protein
MCEELAPRVCPGCGDSGVEFPPYGRICRGCRRRQSAADYFLRTEERLRTKNATAAKQRAECAPVYMRAKIAEKLGVKAADVPMPLAEAAGALRLLRRKLKETRDGRE